MSRWSVQLFSAGLVFVSACSDNAPIPIALNLYEANLTGTISPGLSPHEYKVTLQWERVPIDGYQLFREDEKREVVVLKVLKTEGGQLEDSQVEERGVYSYFVGKVPSSKTIVWRGTIPADYVSKEHQYDSNSPIDILDFNRVYLTGKISTHRPITVRAKEIYAQDTSLDASADSTPPSEPGVKGQDGNRISVFAERIYGDLDVFSHGQPGGPPMKNDEKDIPAGTRGKGGEISVVARERTETRIRVWLKTGPAPYAKPEDCYPYQVKIGSQEELYGKCTGVRRNYTGPASVVGVYVIGTDLYYVAQNLTLFHFKNHKSGMVIHSLGSASAQKNGAAVIYQSSFQRTPQFEFGLGFDGNRLLSGYRLPSHRVPVHAKEFLRFQSEIEDFAKSFSPPWIQPQFPVGVELDMVSMIPWNALNMMRLHPQEFKEVFQDKQIEQIQLWVGKDKFLTVQSGLLSISGFRELDLEKFLKEIREAK